MPLAVLEYVAPLVALFGIGTFVLIGMQLRYKAKSSMRNPEDVAKLSDAVDGLYEQTRLLRDEVTELQERMDFHERLLTQGRKQEADTPI